MDTDTLLDDLPPPAFQYRLPDGQILELRPELKTGDLLRFDRRSGRNLLQDAKRIFFDTDENKSLAAKIFGRVFDDLQTAAIFLYCLVEREIPAGAKVHLDYEKFLDGLAPDQIPVALKGASAALLNFFQKVGVLSDPPVTPTAPPTSMENPDRDSGHATTSTASREYVA